MTVADTFTLPDLIALAMRQDPVSNLEWVFGIDLSIFPSESCKITLHRPAKMPYQYEVDHIEINGRRLGPPKWEPGIDKDLIIDNIKGTSK